MLKLKLTNYRGFQMFKLKEKRFNKVCTQSGYKIHGYLYKEYSIKEFIRCLIQDFAEFHNRESIKEIIKKRAGEGLI